ncbi:MAG: HAMP domain-containing protein [Spirochaetales bacterium]|nr:HAMP domain-containing protein [Spirochaetales bacterium]
MKKLKGFGKTIGGKLIITFSSIIFLSIMLVSVVALVMMANAIKDESLNKLKAVHYEKKHILHDELKVAKSNIMAIGDSNGARSAVERFTRYHNEMNIGATEPYDIKGTTSSNDSLTESYEDIYQDTYLNMHRYIVNFGYHDMFIICEKHGHVMYTDAREVDLGTNLSAGKYSDSGLAEMYRKVVQTNKFVIVDLKPYAPSGGKPAMFIGGPIIDRDGSTIGVIAFQMNIEMISEALTDSEGMGQTGEVYCVGEDLLMRTESKFIAKGETAILTQAVDTKATEVFDSKSLERFEGSYRDYLDNSVEGVYQMLDLKSIFTTADFDWALIAEISTSEVNRPIYILIIVILVIAFVILGVAIVITYFFARSISNPIKRGVAIAQELAKGNLDQSVETYLLDRKDEIGMLAKAFNHLIEKLTEIVSVILGGSQQMATASEQLAAGNQNLSTRTEQQAAALEETSSAIEEMNASIKSNADNTSTANQLALDTAEKAKNGTEAVKKATDAMNDINDSSSQISEIIEVINNIAFQTNLLALNASIEAARAGEQGKGFAVVAVEVRKLAKRSDKAASQISTIIKESNTKVAEGVDITNTAKAMLKEINDSTKKVVSLIGEIAASSQEQLSSVDQINKALTDLDENTQKNASLVEEAASATEELSSQAQEFNSNMEFFNIGDKKVSVKKKSSKSSDHGKSASSFHEHTEEGKKAEKADSKPAKKEETKSKKKQESEDGDDYDIFSDLADESDFSEF